MTPLQYRNRIDKVVTLFEASVGLGIMAFFGWVLLQAFMGGK